MTAFPTLDLQENSASQPSVWMDAISDMLNEKYATYGVEVIRDHDHYEPYWGDAIFFYIVVGNLDSPTVVYDVIGEKYSVMCVEDLLKKCEGRSTTIEDAV